jgi:hypothetical protein
MAGKRDSLMGLKENVILGHLIPAGTGFTEYHRNGHQASVRHGRRRRRLGVLTRNRLRTPSLKGGRVA